VTTFAAIPRYWKAIVAACAPVFLLVQAALTDDSVSQQEAYGIGFAVLVAAGVFAKGNAPAAQERDASGRFTGEAQ
jgi:hypothetical protein